MKIYTHYQSYRKKPYVARWYEGDPSFAEASDDKPRQRNRFFDSATARDEFIEVFRFWVRAQREKLKAEERSLEDASAGYIQSMERVGRNASYTGPSPGCGPLRFPVWTTPKLTSNSRAS